MMAMKKALLPIAVLGFLFAGCSSSAPNQGRKNLALIQASRVGDLGQVSTLLNAGADINAVDEEGWTPYLAASAEGNWKVMKLLQAKGCKTDPGF
ncbi:MAG: hypothetical protein JWP91_4533 [Fibrobacteres bacterium]|nr:hypothetical protein [Fibrobacterota bacterium]